MGDGNRRRHEQTVRMAALRHREDFAALEPARVLQLMTIHRDVGGERLGVAADHQRHWKRPRLRGEIDDTAARDAGFLAGFAPHRLLDGFPRFDETGKAGPLALGKARLASQQTALAVDRQHDDDRVGAGEMLAAAGRAVAAPAGGNDVCRGPAARAEAMARMPAEQRLGLGQRRQVIRGDQRAGGDAAQIGNGEIAAALESFDMRRFDRGCKQWPFVTAAEKHLLAPSRRARQLCSLGKSEHQVGGIALAQTYEFAADNESAGTRIAFQRGQRLGIPPQLGGAVEPAGGEAEPLLQIERSLHADTLGRVDSCAIGIDPFARLFIR